MRALLKKIQVPAVRKKVSSSGTASSFSVEHFWQSRVTQRPANRKFLLLFRNLAPDHIKERRKQLSRAGMEIHESELLMWSPSSALLHHVEYFLCPFVQHQSVGTLCSYQGLCSLGSGPSEAFVWVPGLSTMKPGK